MSEENKVLIQNIITAIEVFDKKLEAFDKDGSSENREEFAKAYNATKELVEKTPFEIKSEISQPWNAIEIGMQGLTMTSNKFMKFATFGTSTMGQNSSLSTIRASILTVLKTLKGMLSGTASAPAATTVAVSQTAAVSEEDKKLISDIIASAEVFDEKLEAFDKDGSSENREEFAKAYHEMKDLMDKAPFEIKSEISQPWNAIEIGMQGLTMTSNKFMKIATFGTSTMGQNSSLSTIRASILTVLKTLKGMLSGTASAPAATTVAVSQTAAVSEEDKKLISDIIASAEVFDEKLEAFDKDGSSENREEFAKAYHAMKDLMDKAPFEIKSEISQPWNAIEIGMQGLTMSSNKFMKVATFGTSTMGQNSSLSTIRASILTVLKTLKGMLSGTASAPAATATATQAAAVSEEDKKLISDIIASAEVFDEKLEAFDKDGSSENREEFAKAYHAMKDLMDKAPFEIKSEISQPWNAIEIGMQGLTMSSNKFMKIATFGTSTMGQNSSLSTIRASILTVLKTLKGMLGNSAVAASMPAPAPTVAAAPIAEEAAPAPVVETAPVVEIAPVVETAPVVEEIVAVETVPVTEEVAPAPVAEPISVAEEIAPAPAVEVAPIVEKAKPEPTKLHAKFCVNCGQKIDLDADFCTYCGTRQSAKPEEEKPVEVITGAVSVPEVRAMASSINPTAINEAMPNTVVVPAGKSKFDVLALLGMIFGIVSMIPYVSMILSLPGLILSAIGLKSQRSKGKAIAGLVLSIIGVIAAFITFVVIISMLGNIGGGYGGQYSDSYYYY